MQFFIFPYATPTNIKILGTSQLIFLKSEKSEFWKNEKNCWRYHHFTHVTISYHVGLNILLHDAINLLYYEFWTGKQKYSYVYFTHVYKNLGIRSEMHIIFWVFTPLTARKIYIKKNEKNPGDIIIICSCVPKVLISW